MYNKEVPREHATTTYKSYMKQIFTYEADSWTTKKRRGKIQAMEMEEQ